MPLKHPTPFVLVVASACLALGWSRTPLWDEDEAHFATIARTMVETGDWVVPTFNGTLAVDKPVLMHWCMAATMTLCGPTEFAARLPAAVATLLTALALLHCGRRWRDVETGVVAALAYVGCLLVAIEAHAATPDAILTALTTWATILAADPFLAAGTGAAAATLPRLSIGRAAAVGGLSGLAVVCKGPIGLVGPAAVVVAWLAWRGVVRHRDAGRGRASALARAVGDVLWSVRPLTILAAAAVAAAPWYVAVSLRTDGAWTAGFFFVHNVGRFLAPMEKHAGSVVFHPLTMLVGFYPWSCFLPLAIVLAGRRVWRRTVPSGHADLLALLLTWLFVWVGGFSAAATKLPNYVLPAYPAAALLVAGLGVEAARRAAAGGGWEHPRWMAAGVASLLFGGLATAAAVLVAIRHGLAGAEPAALVGLVPVGGAVACWWLAGRSPQGAVAAFTLTALLYVAAAAGPGAGRCAAANTLPAFTRSLLAERHGPVRLGTYLVGNPSVVFYAGGRVAQHKIAHDPQAAAFLRSGADAILLVPADRYADIAAAVPPGFGVVARTRPLFRDHDLLAIGAVRDRGPAAVGRTASSGGATR